MKRINAHLRLYMYHSNLIKTHGNKFEGQEEAAHMHVLWPTQPLFTWMAALKFENIVTQPP